jgi:CheY-like chemotaxis protein
MARNGTILWVEDDQNDIVLVGRAMAKVGMGSPAIARDGQEALDYLSGLGEFADRSRHPLPRLLLLDLKLPRRSGLEVLQWLRSQPELRRIPVLIFTSSKETSDVHRAYDLGANAYLVKPVDMNHLLELLRKVQKFWLEANRDSDV